MIWITGIFTSLLMSLLAYWEKSLSNSGVIGAVVVGTLLIGGTGWYGFLVLTFFFVSSSGLSKWSKRKKASNKKGDNIIEKQIEAKGDQRDLFQVIANGGIAAFSALLFTVNAHPIWIIMLASSLAAATSDTWGSEIGRWSRKAPRDCFTWKVVEPGISGAVSGVGTLASLIGAFLTALVALPLLIHEQVTIHPIILLFIITSSGWFGNWVDTWVGAKWQVRYQCNSCQVHTEQKIHCDSFTKQIQGINWVDNDIVNLICTLSAALFSGILYWVLNYIS